MYYLMKPLYLYKNKIESLTEQQLKDFLAHSSIVQANQNISNVCTPHVLVSEPTQSENIEPLQTINEIPSLDADVSKHRSSDCEELSETDVVAPQLDTSISTAPTTTTTTNRHQMVTRSKAGIFKPKTCLSTEVICVNMEPVEPESVEVALRSPSRNKL